MLETAKKWHNKSVEDIGHKYDNLSLLIKKKKH